MPYTAEQQRIYILNKHESTGETTCKCEGGQNRGREAPPPLPIFAKIQWYIYWREQERLNSQIKPGTPDKSRELAWWGIWISRRIGESVWTTCGMESNKLVKIEEGGKGWWEPAFGCNSNRLNIIMPETLQLILCELVQRYHGTSKVLNVFVIQYMIVCSQSYAK